MTNIALRRYLSSTECGELISVFPYNKGTHCHRRKNHRGDHMSHLWTHGCDGCCA